MALHEAMPPGSVHDLEPLIDVKKAAYLLGISVKTLRDWIQDRRIDYVKVGARVMMRPDTIRQFVSKNTRRAAG
jgi:excisionase family DNA binding protein